MATIGFKETLLAIFCFLFLFHRNRSKSSLITSWPVIGMVPGLIKNAHRIHEYITDLIKEGGGTFELRGPWFSGMHAMMTSDPANLHYILSKSFSNFPKGSDHKEIFDILGDGILNSDSDVWKAQRKIAQPLIRHSRYRRFLEKTTRQKVEKGLIPVLEHFSQQGNLVDMQDMFKRFTFDSVSILILGSDPGYMSIEYPDVPCAKAFSEIEEALLYRHIVPEGIWKLQRWLQIGNEKTISKGRKILDEYLARCIQLKREALCKGTSKAEEDNQDVDLLTAYIEEAKKAGVTEISDKSLRDLALNLMVAGRDTIGATLSWFFWLLGKNPSVEQRIRGEINGHLPLKEDNKWGFSSVEELSGLVYLHGAICETLRLYPAVALQHRSAEQADLLPSGHRVYQNMRVVLSLYSMGRLEGIWGKDFSEFKPERWMSGQGESIHVPSYITAFSAGPRSCLGKEMTFIQMKIILIAIIRNYHVQVLEGQTITPSDSVLLDMKHGLKAKVFKIRG